MKRVRRAATMTIALVLAAAGTAGADVDRTILPIQAPEPPRFTELDARNVKAPAPFVVEAPEGAPNVVIILIDDIGFGGPSTFGGPIQTPTLDRLAAEGLRYNNFHTTALCSPTRWLRRHVQRDDLLQRSDREGRGSVAPDG